MQDRPVEIIPEVKGEKKQIVKTGKKIGKDYWGVTEDGYKARMSQEEFEELKRFESLEKRIIALEIEIFGKNNN